ncbi:MAG: MerR family transcriptional regulator [Myxococcota bacterium]
MPPARRAPEASTYPLRVAARVTGISAETIRAWENRHGIVRPTRTAGGTRRYSPEDLERLRQVKAAVDAGNRIGRVAELDATSLAALSEDDTEPEALTTIRHAVEALDSAEAQHLLGLQLSLLGPSDFVRRVAQPLMRELGARWAAGDSGIAAEHLATGILRGMLGTALQPSPATLRAPRVLFATPPDEPHELGLMMAAVVALGAGAHPLYLGADIPIEELLEAVDRSGAEALALGIVTLSPHAARGATRRIRGTLPADVDLWLGGCGASQIERSPGIEHFDTFERLEQRVALLSAHR